MDVLARLYYLATVLANDMKHIHTHAKGHRFDRIHAICEEYYTKASQDADTLVELAIEYNQPVQNGSLAANLLNYRPANLNAYSWVSAISWTRDIVDSYIQALTSALSSSVGLEPDVTNLLEEFLRYWKKENNYKNRARLEEID